MKFLIAVMFSVVSFNALADGIPVPLKQQTPFNWNCSDRSSLHLMVNRYGTGKNSLFIQDHAQIGTFISDEVVAILKSKDYSALSGQTITDTRFNRTTTFSVSGNRLSVKLVDLAYNSVRTALECVAAF